jgi:hypothetical protein
MGRWYQVSGRVSMAAFAILGSGTVAAMGMLVYESRGGVDIGKDFSERARSFGMIQEMNKVLPLGNLNPPSKQEGERK